jgi:hypothetical protein
MEEDGSRTFRQTLVCVLNYTVLQSIRLEFIKKKKKLTRWATIHFKIPLQYMAVQCVICECDMLLSFPEMAMGEEVIHT